ncbi:uncharacterized protein LOC143276953 isoform X2 [Babylonia areolata]|uniref:uncharacterized protein LOC143276953 isoform X2 n=1 Tax=Babylonia areolata TaxID=304850 RepID=UPI003FD5B41C
MGVHSEQTETKVVERSKSTKSRKFIKFSPRLRKKSRSKENAVKKMEASGATSRDHSLQIPNGLNEKEKQELESVFEMFDKNKDGKISCEELGVVLRTLGHRYSHAEIEDMIKIADKNDNGFVEYDEFVLLMKRASAATAAQEGGQEEAAAPKEAPDEAREAFEIFDMDGNGYIDRHELRFIMSRLGENPEEEDICEMFRHADLNGDGLIDYDEFTRLMTTMAQGGLKKTKGGRSPTPSSKSKSKKK